MTTLTPFRLTKDRARSTLLAADRAHPGNAGATKGVWVMSTRRDWALGLILAGTASALAGGMAQAKVSEADALQALDPWADALFTGDPAAVDQVLAEEFQILRSNGSGHEGELSQGPSQPYHPVQVQRHHRDRQRRDARDPLQDRDRADH